MVSKAASEKTIPTTEAVPEMNALGKIKTIRMLDGLSALVEQWDHRVPLGPSWSFCGPMDHLLKMMREKFGADGLPQDGPSLLAWIRVPDNSKVLRAANLRVTVVPHPRGPSQRGLSDPNIDPEKFPPMIRLEKAAPGMVHIVNQ